MQDYVTWKNGSHLKNGPLKNRSKVKKWLLLAKVGHTCKNGSWLRKMADTWKNESYLKRRFKLETMWKVVNANVFFPSYRVAVEYDNARIVESNAREPMSIIETPCGVPRQMTSLLVHSLLVRVESFARRLCTSFSLLRALRFVWSMEPTCAP